MDDRTMKLRSLILCLPMLLLGIGPQAKAETLIVASDHWCPYNCAEADGREGYAVDILRTIFEPLGIVVDYRLMGWERAVEEARRGHATAVIGAIEKEVPGFILPEENIGVSALAFFVRANDPWRYRGVESFLGKSLGIPDGYGLDSVLEDFLAAHQGEIALYRAGRQLPAQHNLQLLMEGRLDIVGDNAQVVRYLANSMGIGESVTYAGDDECRTPLYIAFSPADQRSARYAALFDEGIRRLRKTERLRAILARYGLTDWK